MTADRQAHTPGPTGKAKLAYVPDIVKNAMLVAWNEICTDTDCHPLDIDHSKARNGQAHYLTFEPRHWAQMAGRIVADQIGSLFEEELTTAVAASELLELLKLIRFEDNEYLGVGTRTDPITWQEWEAKRRAVIAKAEGR